MHIFPMDSPKHIANGSPCAAHGFCNIDLPPTSSAQTSDFSHLLRNQFPGATTSVLASRDGLKMIGINTGRLATEVIKLQPGFERTMNLNPHQYVRANPPVLAADTHVSAGMVGLPSADPARTGVPTILKSIVICSEDDTLAPLVVTVDKASTSETATSTFTLHIPNHIVSVGQ